jgi:hypothetical protein
MALDLPAELVTASYFARQSRILELQSPLLKRVQGVVI